MSSRRFVEDSGRHFANRADGVAKQGGAAGPEPRAEDQDYPFICGFSLWTNEECHERP